MKRATNRPKRDTNWRTPPLTNDLGTPAGLGSLARQEENNNAMDMSIALGVGLGIGLAVLGAGIGQGMTANGAVSGISRQPEAAGKIQTAMIIGLALIESLVILTFVVVNGMAGKVPAPAKTEGTGASLTRPIDAKTKVAMNNVDRLTGSVSQ